MELIQRHWELYKEQWELFIDYWWLTIIIVALCFVTVEIMDRFTK